MGARFRRGASSGCKGLSLREEWEGVHGRLVVGDGSSPPSKPSPVEGEGWGEGGGVCGRGDSAKLP